MYIIIKYIHMSNIDTIILPVLFSLNSITHSHIQKAAQNIEPEKYPTLEYS